MVGGRQNLTRYDFLITYLILVWLLRYEQAKRVYDI